MMRLLLCALLLIMPVRSIAHGQHQWIQDGGYRSPTDGTACCGNGDCATVHPTNVKHVPGGWMVRMGDTVVAIPDSDVQWSEDGQYSICIWGGMIKCFFVPPVGA